MQILESRFSIYLKIIHPNVSDGCSVGLISGMLIAICSTRHLIALCRPRWALGVFVARSKVQNDQ